MSDKEALIQTISVMVARYWEMLSKDPYLVPVGISARHIHLSREHVDRLFGAGYQLKPMKPLSQPGQYACEEQVEVKGPRGTFEKVRVLGPERNDSQVELSAGDCRFLGVEPVVRTSGDLKETPGIRLLGTEGEVELKEGVIVADRHIHMTPEDAAWFGVSDRERVSVVINGPKSGMMSNVVIRISPGGRLDLHIDTDDANAFQLKQGQWLSVRKESAV